MKIRLLIVVLLGLFIFLGWYTLINNQKKMDDAYNSDLDYARDKRNLGLNELAYNSYKEALKKQESIELRTEIIDFLTEVNSFGTLEKEIQELLDKYPKDKISYEYACRYAIASEDIGKLYDLANTMNARKVSSEVVEALCEEHRFDFYVIPKSKGYFRIDPFIFGFARVYSKDGSIGYMDSYGNITIEPLYSVAAPYGGIDYFTVKEDEGETVFIDLNGVRSQVDNEKRHMVFEDIQGFNDGQMAVCENGVYRYIDTNYNNVGENNSFLFAGMFNNGIAAVKSESGWYLIDHNHNQVSPIYEEVKLTENGVADIGGVVCVKQNGLWYIAGEDGNIKSSEGYVDISCCLDNSGAGAIAVKKGDKWGFVNDRGEKVLDFVYDNARSFCRGYAAVQKGDKWTLINETGNEMMEPQFEAMYEMNGAGFVPVLTDTGWKLLAFYGG